jgi:hypothetical protein
MTKKEKITANFNQMKEELVLCADLFGITDGAPVANTQQILEKIKEIKEDYQNICNELNLFRDNIASYYTFENGEQKQTKIKQLKFNTKEDFVVLLDALQELNGYYEDTENKVTLKEVEVKKLDEEYKNKRAKLQVEFEEEQENLNTVLQDEKINWAIKKTDLEKQHKDTIKGYEDKIQHLNKESIILHTEKHLRKITSWKVIYGAIILCFICFAGLICWWDYKYLNSLSTLYDTKNKPFYELIAFKATFIPLTIWAIYTVANKVISPLIASIYKWVEKRESLNEITFLINNMNDKAI